MQRYLVHPGYIRSDNDGDMHWIGARDLMRLYGVPPSQCHVFDTRTLRGTLGVDVGRFEFYLYPRHGDYPRYER